MLACTEDSVLSCECDEADTSSPCRGFTGDCSDLPNQLADVPGSPFAGGYTCLQFPAPDSGRDQIIAALIMTVRARGGGGSGVCAALGR